jgi:hypothetical protein
MSKNLKMIIDDYELNNMTVTDYFPLFVHEEIKDRLQRQEIFL